MSEWTLAGLALALALAVVAAAFFGLRGLRPRDPVKRDSHPPGSDSGTGSDRSDSRPDSGSSTGPTEPVFAEGGSGVDNGKSTGPVQQSLEMTSFVPPKLPAPSEELLPLDICHSVRLHCREGEAMAAAELGPLEAGLREAGLPVFRFLACGDDGEWRKVSPDATGTGTPGTGTVGSGTGTGGGWEFRNWLVALPLADRGGRMTEEKIRAVERETRRFAELRRLQPSFPPTASSLENAKLVDDFCERVDIELALHVDGPSRPSRASVEKMLRLQGLTDAPVRAVGKGGTVGVGTGPVMGAGSGMVSGGNGFGGNGSGNGNGAGGSGSGRLVWTRDGEVRYSAQPRRVSSSPGEVSSVVFRLDVPNVSDPARAFDEMLECAAKVARVFYFKVRDPDGRDIGEDRARELRMLALGVAEDMRAHGVAPGGDVARLLFS